MSLAEATWLDLEYESYADDLPIWRALASRCEGPIVEFGAGTGRVSSALAQMGCEVIAIEVDPCLWPSLRARTPPGSRVTVTSGDARLVEPCRQAALVIAAMSLVQTMGTSAALVELFRQARAWVRDDGRFAFHLVPTLPPPGRWSAERSNPSQRLRRHGAEHSLSNSGIVAEASGISIALRRGTLGPGQQKAEWSIDRRIARISTTECIECAESVGWRLSQVLRLIGSPRSSNGEVVVMNAH